MRSALVISQYHPLRCEEAHPVLDVVAVAEWCPAFRLRGDCPGQNEVRLGRGRAGAAGRLEPDLRRTSSSDAPVRPRRKVGATQDDGARSLLVLWAKVDPVRRFVRARPAGAGTRGHERCEECQDAHEPRRLHGRPMSHTQASYRRKLGALARLQVSRDTPEHLARSGRRIATCWSFLRSSSASAEYQDVNRIGSTSAVMFASVRFSRSSDRRAIVRRRWSWRPSSLVF
jgi:hypothetical protein